MPTSPSKPAGTAAIATARPKPASKTARKSIATSRKSSATSIPVQAREQTLPATVWTIGHSTRSLEEFLGLLKHNDIEAIADVRRFPGSRRYPYFGSEALAASLTEAGIGYRWMPELGGRRRVAPDSPHTVWRNAAFRGYADYMQTEEFKAAFDLLLEFAREQRTCLMCAEAVWWRCHRSMISDDLKSRGIEVLHIMDAGKTTEHPYTAPARIVDGRLSYAQDGLLSVEPDAR